MIIRKTQYWTIWLLPLIVIGGLFLKWLGYLVLGMMIFFLVLSFFKSRWWCWHLCPRGAFLDIIVSMGSFNRALPEFWGKIKFRRIVFVVFMAFFAFRLIRSKWDALAVGAIFISMCLVTTIIAVVLGILTKHRPWCVVCPMGYLQNIIGSAGRKRHNATKH